MADEEQKTETTAPAGEPKSVEMSASVTKKAAPKKKAAAKKAPAKKAAVEKAAPVAAAAVAATPAATKAAPAAPRRSYTPPPRSMWWQALIFIAIVVYAFSLIRGAAKGTPDESSNAAAVQSTAQDAVEPQLISPPQMMPMPPMPPMHGMGGGFGNGMGPSGREQGAMPPAVAQQPQTTPDAAPQMQPMPPRPYGMPAYPYPQQGYGFYGPGGYYGPGPMPYQYQPQPMPNN